MAEYRIALVDDHAIVRQGLRLILETNPDFRICAEGESGEDAIAIAERVVPDVMLMDVHMPEGLDGITATHHIRDCCPGIRVVMLTMFDDEIHMERMLAAGAAGVLLKHGDSAEIFAAIRTAAHAKPYLPSRLPNEMRQRLQQHIRGQDASLGGLSPRELEVLVYLAKGFTNKEVSARLHISIKTVETHRSNMMKRLHLKSRAQLVQYALQNGFIEALPTLIDEEPLH